jgi:integrase
LEDQPDELRNSPEAVLLGLDELDYETGWTTYDDRDSTLTTESVPLSIVRERIRKALLRNVSGFSEWIGLRLKIVEGPDQSPTLQAIIEAYTQRSDLTTQTKNLAAAWWAGFVEAVKPATKVGEITKGHVLAYRDRVKGNPNLGAKTIKHHFAGIRTILRYAQTQGMSCPELSQLLDHCRMLVPPKADKKPKPHPINRENYHALLDAAADDSRMLAILLIALNLAMYSKEVTDIDLTDIDHEKGTFIAERGKTSIIRVGVLWERTRKAITRYLAEHPHDSGPLFISPHGRLSHWTIRDDWRELRTKAGVGDSVLFEHIRDGAQTAAIEKGADPMHTKMLLGHAVGIDDAYLLRNPRMVADSCEAIERHYFPPSHAKPARKKKKPT